MTRPHPNIAQFEIGPFKNFVYLILDPGSKQAAIVDPQKDLSPLLTQMEKDHRQLTGIFVTHSHHDHVAGLQELVQKFPEVPVYIHPEELHRLKGLDLTTLKKISDGEVIPVGNLAVRVIHTPGHSTGECCFYLEAEGAPPCVLTGDTVFIRDCGRTDLETGSTAQMFDSLQKIKALPSKTLIFPGHHYREEGFSILETELRTSPPLLCQSVLELEALP